MSKEWQQRIVEAAGIQLKYAEGSGDSHIFTPLKKITHSEAEEIAARILALPGILFAEPPPVEMSVDLAGPVAPLPPENRLFNPGMSSEELKVHRESMKSYLYFWTITVALTTRNARNPQPLSKEWQQRILEAAGVSLGYVGMVEGGDTHTFKPTKKITHSEAEEIAARIRALPGILFAEPPPVEMSVDLAAPNDPLLFLPMESEGRHRPRRSQPTPSLGHHHRQEYRRDCSD